MNNITSSRISFTLFYFANKFIKRKVTYDSSVINFNRTITQKTASAYRFSTDSTNLVTCELTSRATVELKGVDVAKLLQGLITNDIKQIEDVPGGMLYTLMLNVKGRVMYDLFIHNASNESDPHRFLVDCDGSVVRDFLSVITRYKIRKQVQLQNLDKDMLVSVIIPKISEDRMTEPLTADLTLPSMWNADPRMDEFAYRILHAPKDKELLRDYAKFPEGHYAERRYCWGVGEGTTDLPPGNCLPLESNVVLTNGANFEKGCYLGQELTARTKYTGVVRKRLMPLLFDCDPGAIESGVPMTSADGKSAGKYRHHVGRHGLGLVRLAEVKGGKLRVPRLNEADAEAEVVLPHWWPQDCVDALEKNRRSNVAGS